MPYTISTNRGCKKLVDDNNHTYRKNKCVNKVWYWKCVVSKCGGKAKTRHEQDREGKDVVSEFAMTNAHTHCENPKNNYPLRMKQKHESLAEVTQEKPSGVVPKTGKNISLGEISALTNGDSNVSRNEFYLVPIHEMEDLQNSSKTSINHKSMKLKKKEREIIENENMNKQTRIELHGHLNRIFRESNDQNNSVVTSSDSPSGSVKMQQNKINLNDIKYLKFIYASVPDGLEQDAYNLISKLEKSNVIRIDDLGYVTLSRTGDEVKLKDLLRAIFVHNARVTHIESFLSKILKDIDENIIKNEKLIKLLGGEKIKKYDFECHRDEDGFENFHDTMQDIAMSLSGSGNRVTNKLISWIIY